MVERLNLVRNDLFTIHLLEIDIQNLIVIGHSKFLNAAFKFHSRYAGWTVGVHINFR